MNQEKFEIKLNLKYFKFFRGGAAAFFKIKPNFEFFTNYHLKLHGEQLSVLHSQLLTKLLYYMSSNMVYTRIIGSRQIGNYLAGHVLYHPFKYYQIINIFLQRP